MRTDADATTGREDSPMTTPEDGTPHPIPHYKEPDWFTRNVFNHLVSGLTRLGISVRGSRVLEHRGRISGELHHTPVNLLTVDGTRYLVSPRGETQWVRNVRHAGGHLVLILGRKRQLCTASEVPEADRIEILRTYLRRWKFETGMFFDGVTPDSSADDWATEAARHPVFALA
jgi:deazaflavin-dependent oxidoreductase (nitroreductase family)